MNGEVNDVTLIENPKIPVLKGKYGDKLPDVVWKDITYAAAFRRWLCRQLRWTEEQTARSMKEKRRALWHGRLEQLRVLLALMRKILVEGHDVPPDQVGCPFATLESYAAVKRAVDNDARFERFRRCP